MDVEDARRSCKNTRHEFIDLIVLSVLGVVCGANGWKGIEVYGNAKLAWLKTFLSLPGGIPSQDTLARVFARINPAAFTAAFASYVSAVAAQALGREVVAIDGKTARRSHDRANDKGPIHTVSAWACKGRVTLAQVATDQKSNEITAIPKLSPSSLTCCHSKE